MKKVSLPSMCFLIQEHWRPKVVASRNGSRPTDSMLTTTAGLVFWISAPTDGSKQMSQISPRLGFGGVDIQILQTKSFEIRQFFILGV